MIFVGAHQKTNKISKKYAELIKNAKEEIVIGNLYFSPVKSIFQAFLESVNREVDLTVITNGISDLTPVYTEAFAWSNRMTYVPVFYGRTFHFWESSSAEKNPVKKTKIFEYHVRDILYHKKVMIVDRRYLVVGSYNLGHRSDKGDYELALVIDSPVAAERALKIIEKDLKHCVEVSPQDARKWYFDPATAYLGELQKRLHGIL